MKLYRPLTRDIVADPVWVVARDAEEAKKLAAEHLETSPFNILNVLDQTDHFLKEGLVSKKHDLSADDFVKRLQGDKFDDLESQTVSRVPSLRKLLRGKKAGVVAVDMNEWKFIADLSAAPQVRMTATKL